jgi:hypothetical protein
MSLNTILATAPLTATGYHLKATGTALGQSLIWDNGTNVGIGNTNTSYTLDVSGTGRFTSDLLVVRNATMSSYVANVTGTAGAGVGSQFLLQDGGTNVAWFRRNRDGAGVTELANVDGTFIIKTGATAAINALTIASTGAATFSSSVSTGGALNITVPYSASTMTILTQDNLGNGIYLGPRSNLNFDYGVAGNTIGIINNFGYQNGSAHFRSLQISNGKGSSIAFFDGTTGNVGIGITPFANGLSVGLDMAGGAGLFGFNNRVFLTGNAYYTTDWKYKTTSGAALIQSGGDGSIQILNADSGTINTTIPFVERIKITSTGNVGIGMVGYGDMRLVVRGAGTSSATFGFRVENSAANALFQVRNDGLTETGTQTNSPYNISATGRTAILSSSGVLGYLVSTRESKANIESIKNIDFINKLNPVQFNYRKKDYTTNEFTDELYDNITYGFIADEVEKVNKELVFYNSDGTTLAGVDYNSMIAILTKAVQEQQAQIEELKAEIDELKNK